jgi:hypothetical protein
MRTWKFLRILSILPMLLSAAFFSEAEAQLPDFTQSFDLTIAKIAIDSVADRSLLHESDPINIRTIDGSPVRVFNLRGTTVYQGPPGGLPPLPVGHYFVEGGGDRAQFLILPGDYQGAPFLGTEAPDGSDTNFTAAIALIKPGCVRVMGAGDYWNQVQAGGPTFWTWGGLDRTVATNAGRRIIIEAFLRPWWQTNDNEFASSYATYVKAMAKRYGNNICAIEMWNEPWFNVGFILSIPGTNYPSWLANYIELVAAGQQAVRSSSRTIQVWGPAYSGDSSNLDNLEGLDFSHVGGLSLIDTYSWHHYEPKYPPDAKSVYLRTDDRLDYIIERTGALGLAVDEVGLMGQSALGIPSSGDYVSNPPINWHRGMCRAIKDIVMHIGGGVRTYIPHVFALYDCGDTNGVHEIYGWEYASTQGYGCRSRGPHPKTSATLMTAYWLNGANLLGRRVLADKVFLYAWQRPNGERVTFAWSLEDQPVALQLDGTETITDIFGRPLSVTQLTEEPALFHDTNTTDVSSLLDGIAAKLSKEDVNRAPVLDPIGAQAVSEGSSISLAIAGADPDNDPLTYSAGALPPGAAFDVNTRRFTWTPTAAQTGTWPITFSVSDGSATTSQQVAINVSNPPPSQGPQTTAAVTNSPPVWTITPPQTAERNRTLTFTVAPSDPDRDPLTYAAVDLPSGATFDQTTQTIRWTPTVSQNGAYAITFLASDGLATATQVVAIAVNGSAAAPIMTRIKPKPVKAGRPLKIRLTAKSPLKKPLSYLAMSLPPGASFDPVFHQFLWTPDATQIGNHTVTFIATDGRFTDTQSVTLTVLAP